MAKTEEMMRALEQSLAYEFALTVIDAATEHAEPEGEDSSAIWHDVTPPTEEDDAALLGEAVEYLDWRGLIVRHASNPNFVQIQDECEPLVPGKAGA